MGKMDNEIFIVNGCKCLMRNFNKTYNTIHFEIQIIVLIPWQILDYAFCYYCSWKSLVSRSDCTFIPYSSKKQSFILFWMYSQTLS